MLFFSYLRRHIKIIIMVLAFVCIFALVFSLYDLPAEAVLYSALLCLFAGVILFIIGYTRFLKRHRELRDMESSIRFSTECLPEPRGELERDYQRLIAELQDEKNAISIRAGSERQDTIDYFTLWVHQIKTPIAASRLILQSGGENGNALLEAELLQIEQYVEMVLSYLRLGSETSDYVFRRCDVDNIIRECVRKFARLFILRKISLSFDGTGLNAMTDEKWLAFVICQVLSNALKYTPEGGRIRIFAEKQTLCVADNGIGIRSEDLPRVFEKGFTGYNGREDKKSTGIGLYLCKRVCSKLGHGISISSLQGQGVTVRIDLSTYEGMLE